MDKKQVVFLDDWENWFQGSIDSQPIQEFAEVKFISQSLLGNELIAELQQCSVLVLFRERTKITESILRQCPKLERVICTGAQNRNLDLKTAAELGIEVSYAKGGGNSKDSTCEMTWALILSAFKRLNLLMLSSSQPAWRKNDDGAVFIPSKLNGRCLGVIGLGHIGQKVAKIAQAFGMEVICWSPHMTQQRAEEYGVRYVSKEVLLQSADVISLHLVLSGTTKHILDAKELSLCKKNVSLVNTARAELVNQEALLDFLRNNPTAIYATDVFEQEPIVQDHPFFECKNVLMTGHWGFVCDEVLEGFTKDVQKQLNDFCLMSEKESSS